MSDFLICFHVPTNTGYAIEPLEIAFYKVARSFLGTSGHLHLGYQNIEQGRPRWLKEEDVKLLELNYTGMSKNRLKEISDYIESNNIEVVLAFDLPVGAQICKALKNGGTRTIISYWGAPMSSINHGLKLLLKRIQVFFTRFTPDHFIFESYGMQNTATNGRGILKKDTSIARLGIDIDTYSTPADKSYVANKFNIPANRKIIFYSGHMEKRKGVDIILKAANYLINLRHMTDLHFLICGNRPGEEELFSSIYKGTDAEKHITFGGYRHDIPEIMIGCFLGIIASTGWDSFPRSSLEMAAAGLPILVSDLAGLNETIDPGITGLLFQPGNYIDLANKVEHLSNNLAERERLAENAVNRVQNNFSLEIQHNTLLFIINKIAMRHK